MKLNREYAYIETSTEQCYSKFMIVITVSGRGENVWAKGFWVLEVWFREVYDGISRMSACWHVSRSMICTYRVGAFCV